MSGFSPLSRDEFRAIAANQLTASLIAAGIPLTQIPDTGPDAIMGAVCDCISAVAEQIQFQAAVDQASSRLATTPANADGTVSDDAASYAAPFGIVPAPGGFATSTTFRLNLASLAAVPTTVPCGLVLVRSDGIQYLVVADTTQANYNGSQGYTIPANTPFLTVTATCLSVGLVGNVTTPSSATWSIYTGPGAFTAPGISSVTNATAFLTASAPDDQIDFNARFTLSMQNGQWGVATAIIGKALAVKSDLICSYGDHVNADGSYHAAYFTLVINMEDAATAPDGILLGQVSVAISDVRSGGIEYQVIAPTLILPAITGSLNVFADFNKASVVAAVQKAVQAYVNHIGLDRAGGSTTLSYIQLVAIVAAVPGVNAIGSSVQINALTGADVTAPFASQIVCPAPPAFVAL